VARALLRVAAVMDLCLASHRAILKALAAFEDGELALTALGPLTITTEEGLLRFYDGTCFSAPGRAWVGADLVGWLEELDHLSGVGAWWRPGLRAVLRTRDGRYAVTQPSQDCSINDEPASCGAATHAARFLVAHGEVEPEDARATRPFTLVSRYVAPLPPSPGKVAAPASELPADSDSGLRERGTWRSTAVVPWTLGDGRPPPQLTQPDFPADRPSETPARKTPVYTSPPPRVRVLPRAVPPPRRPAARRLSNVA